MRAESGAALVAAMFAVVVLTAAASSVSASLLRTGERTQSETARAVAFAAADAGLALARVRLAEEHDWPGSQVLVGGCEVLVEAVRTADGGHHVVVVARHRPRGELGLPVTCRSESTLDPSSEPGGLPQLASWTCGDRDPRRPVTDR